MEGGRERDGGEGEWEGRRVYRGNILYKMKSELGKDEMREQGE